MIFKSQNLNKKNKVINKLVNSNRLDKISNFNIKQLINKKNKSINSQVLIINLFKTFTYSHKEI